MEYNELLKAFGAKIGLPELSAEEDGVCRLSIDGMIVDIKVTDDARNLMLFGEIASVPEERGDELLRQVLRGNFLFSATDGATLSLDGDSRKLCLQQHEALSLLDGESLYALIASFVNTIENWKAIVDGFAEAIQNGDISEERNPFADMDGMLRV